MFNFSFKTITTIENTAKAVVQEIEKMFNNFIVE